MKQVVTVVVKGMVCYRCVFTLRQAFKAQGIELKAIELGKITVIAGGNFSYSTLSEIVSPLGFEILQDKQSKLIERIKELVDGYISPAENQLKFSEVISDQLHMNYDQLSSIFSGREGITLEQYIIAQKIAKVKHLLSSTSLSITDISYQVNYSSVHHLSRQFKQMIGFNPSEYREMHHLKMM